MSERMLMLLVGDLILDEPNPDGLFDLARPRLQGCGLLVGHVEVLHTSRGQKMRFDVPAPPSDPANLSALKRAGFHVATLAGNHIADAGPNGVAETIEELHWLGITTTGAGMNLTEARRPAWIESKGLRFGFLSYNCVGPEESWAGMDKAGCAYVGVLTQVASMYASPGSSTTADAQTLDAMAEDITALRPLVDILAVALHKGLGHTPATVGFCEHQTAKCAIDSGVDIVVGHHAYIPQGMDFYRNRPIFNGLGNFAIASRALSIEGNSSPERRAWAERRRKLFGFEPDPEYVTYPFHPEAKNAIIAFCQVDRQGVRSAGFIPCFVNKHSQPEVLGDDDRGRAVATYVRDVTTRAGPKARYKWEGNRVLFFQRDNL